MSYVKSAETARNDFLTAAMDLINGPRAADYGDAFTAHSNIALGWTFIANEAFRKHGKITAAHVALMMDWLKTCRAVNNLDSEDSWADKLGYTALGAEAAHIQRKFSEKRGVNNG